MGNPARKIGIWSVEYGLITGQAVVTKRVVEHVLCDQIKQRRRYIFQYGGRPAALISWVLAALKLWLDVAFGRVDTLYLVCSRSNAGFMRDIPALATGFLGVRVVVHVHGVDIVCLLKGRSISRLARFFYQRTELILPSAHFAPQLADLELKGIHLCENFTLIGENNHTYNRGDEQSGQGLTVLWNSNIMASKGAFDLFEAVARLCREGLDIKLHVTGSVMSDEEMTRVDALQAFEPFQQCAFLTYKGAVPPADMAKLMERADVIALPSCIKTECQPLSVIDGMCAGKAVIATDLPGLVATVGSYPASFIPPRSVDTLIEALRAIYDEKRNDPAGFISRRRGPAQLARERFSTERFESEMRTILRCG